MSGPWLASAGITCRDLDEVDIQGPSGEEPGMSSWVILRCQARD